MYWFDCNENKLYVLQMQEYQLFHFTITCLHSYSKPCIKQHSPLTKVYKKNFNYSAIYFNCDSTAIKTRRQSNKWRRWESETSRQSHKWGCSESETSTHSNKGGSPERQIGAKHLESTPNQIQNATHIISSTEVNMIELTRHIKLSFQKHPWQQFYL